MVKATARLARQRKRHKRLIVHKPVIASNVAYRKLIVFCVDECAISTPAIGIGYKDIVAAAI